MRLRLAVVVACVGLAALLLASPNRANFTTPALVPLYVPARVPSAPLMQQNIPPEWSGPTNPFQFDESLVEMETGGEPQPMYKVVLFNDNANLREYVARAITMNCFITSREAYSVMQDAHKDGFSLIGIFNKGKAEVCHEGLRDRGLNSAAEPASEAEIIQLANRKKEIEIETQKPAATS
jgi:ATP-dependent Clp protease adapter protein ClpS